MDWQDISPEYRFFAESLSTHKALTPDDIDWASDVLSKLIAVPYSKKMVLALLANRKTATGKYARLYNLTLRDIIAKRSEERMEKLCEQDFDHLYPEIS